MPITKREEYEALHQFIFGEQAKVSSWFYIWQEVNIDDIAMELPEQQDNEWDIKPMVPVMYRCILDKWENRIARNIDAKDLQPIE